MFSFFSFYPFIIPILYILFGKSTKENLLQLDEQTFTDVFKDVPHYEVSKDVLGQPAVDVFNQEGMQISQARVRCVSSLRVVALHSTRKTRSF